MGISLFDCRKRTLAVFSHPNHEIAVYGLICRMRPAIAFLTDGGGGARLEQTGQGLLAAGISSDVTYLNYTEESFYRAILGRDAAFFDQVVSRLAEWIRACSPEQILCDAVEYYNPIHDIALPVVFGATRALGSSIPIFSVPLVYQGSAPPEQLVFQRALPGERHLEEPFPISNLEGISKRHALRSIYAALMAQMAFPDAAITQACLEEHLHPAGAPFGPVDPLCVIRYDRRGEEAKKAGLVQEAISYRHHYLPLVRDILA